MTKEAERKKADDRFIEKPKTWGDIYWKWRRKGMDHGGCAYQADLWEARTNKGR